MIKLKWSTFKDKWVGTRETTNTYTFVPNDMVVLKEKTGFETWARYDHRNFMVGTWPKLSEAKQAAQAYMDEKVQNQKDRSE